MVEAHAFNRRRLVTAFLSGAPGGREVEPARPARAVVAGAVLAVLVVAGAAVAGYLRPGLPDGWNDNTLVVARGSGARYVATGGTLYPVANITSARLLLPADKDFRVVLAPEDKIADEPRGSDIGIVGAPDALPERDALIQSGWSSCVDQSGQTRLRVDESPAVAPAPERSALLVDTGSDLVVITGSARFRVAENGRAAALRALGLDAVQPLRAPGSWVDLFPAGQDLAPLSVAGAGEPLPAGVGRPGGLSTYGTLVLVTEPGGSERPYVLTKQGLSPLSELAAALYQVGPSATAPVRLTQADVAQLPTAEPLYPQDWPTQTLTPLTQPVPCALLTSDPDQLPVTTLAVATDPAAAPTAAKEAVVQPAHGAVVRAVSGGVVNRGTVYLVDPTGTRFALSGSVETVLAQLGYTGLRPASVSQAWVDALRDGPELSSEAARQVVSAG
nr:type VII secretion protein EccB [Motilibacter deserti]